MCDCYYHRCAKCSIEFDMHLGDFATERSEVAVFCKKHIPKDAGHRMRIFKYWREGFEKGKPQLMAVEYLTANAWKRRLQNEPNGKSELVEERK